MTLEIPSRRARSTAAFSKGDRVPSAPLCQHPFFAYLLRVTPISSIFILIPDKAYMYLQISHSSF